MQPISTIKKSHTLGRLRERIWILVLFVVLAAVGAGVVAALQPRMYTASIELLFRDSGLDQKLFGSSGNLPSRDATREAATNLKLVKTEQVAERAAQKLGSGESAEGVTEMVEVQPNGQSNLVSVSATARDPAYSKLVAETYGSAFISLRREAEQAKIASARRAVDDAKRALPAAEKGTATERALEDDARRLDLLTSMQTGNVELVQPAQIPQTPSSPRVVRTAVLGGLAGLVVGCVLLWFQIRTDRRVRSVDEVEAAAGVTVLASVPEAANPKHKGDLVGGEHFSMLLARLEYFSVGREIQMVMVASATAGEGKSTVAAGMAVAAARSHRRTLLIEADLRRPSLSSRLHLEPGAGVSDVILGRETLAGAVRRPVLPGAVACDADMLDVLPAGPVPPNPLELLESDAMKALLIEARDRYEFIVLDTPPMSVVPDSLPLIGATDGSLVVARADYTNYEALERLAADVAKVNGRLLGAVLNAADSIESYYYYPSNPSPSKPSSVTTA